MAARRSRAKGTGKSARLGAPGKPPHVPTEEMRVCVSAMAGSMISHVVIAKALNIAPDTLRRHYADELDGGGALAFGKVVAAHYRCALSGDVNAQKFILARRGGAQWRETDAASSEPVTLVIRRELAAPSVTPAPAAAEPSVVDPPEVAP